MFWRMKRNSVTRSKIPGRRLAALSGIMLALIFGCATVFAAGDSEIIKLTKRKTSDNTAFSVSNMFPGDQEENNYCVSVTYKGDAALYFQATVQDGYEKLAEVLQMSVAEVADDGTQTVVYEGLIGGMTEAVGHSLSSSGKATDEVYYLITVWLDTSVGNDYENLSLIADLTWWVETEEEEESSGSGDSEDTADSSSGVKTGDTARIGMWAAIFICAVIILVVLIAARFRKRREDDDA